MTREEQINDKVHELGQTCFPDECNIWARKNYEAQKVEWACKQMVEWVDTHPKEGLVSIDKVCDYLYKLNQMNFKEYGRHCPLVNVPDFRKAMEE